MRKIWIPGILAAVLFGYAARAEVQKDWLENFEAAKAKAVESGRPILADFTGSDWCGWCIKLDREVFSKDAFKTFASENVVLFKADFPREKTQPNEVKKQNAELAKHYGVRGFPTILLLDGEGKQLATTGYKPGGAEAYVEHIKGLLKQAGEKQKEKGK